MVRGSNKFLLNSDGTIEEITRKNFDFKIMNRIQDPINGSSKLLKKINSEKPD